MRSMGSNSVLDDAPSLHGWMIRESLADLFSLALEATCQKRSLEHGKTAGY